MISSLINRVVARPEILDNANADRTSSRKKAGACGATSTACAVPVAAYGAPSCGAAYQQSPYQSPAQFPAKGVSQDQGVGQFSQGALQQGTFFAPGVRIR